MSPKGKYALITGSSRGIGRGIAVKLAEQGVNVAVHYYQNDAAAKDTLERIRKHGSDGFVVQADVSRADDVRRMFGRVKSEFGALDIFVSNARPELSAFYQAPMDITLDKWDMALDSQAKAFLVGVHESTRLMGKGGRILAVTYAPSARTDRKSTRLNSSHGYISYAVFCLKKKKTRKPGTPRSQPRAAVCSLTYNDAPHKRSWRPRR